MVYESSYGTGQKPFAPDTNRGKWEKPTDFIFACLGLSFKLDILTATFWFFFDLGLIGILPYYVYMVLFMVPIMVIHTYLGQFSTSGFISAFRLAPFFKGMGYVSAFLTVSVLIYYGIFAAVPLLFMVNSLRPTMPWSCEGLKTWYNLTYSTICNFTLDKDELIPDDNGTESYSVRLLHIPSVFYFQTHIQTGYDFYTSLDIDYELSWNFVGFFIVVWAMIAFIFYKFSEVPQFGRFIRIMVIVTSGLIVVCFVRFLFLPGALTGILSYVAPKDPLVHFVAGTGTSFIMVLQSFGSGWGSVIALSSFNDFKTNIMSYSWIISFGQVLIYIMFGMVNFILETHFMEMTEESSAQLHVLTQWTLFLSGASALSSMHWANLWTFVYYTMLLMAALIVICTQIFTVLQSLFDEFEYLRQKKQQVTFGFIGGLALCSLYFCTNHGIIYFSVISLDNIFSHCLLHLLLIFVVLWIYGRVRFQRDIEFMLGQPFVSWKVNILRFVSPILLVIALISSISIVWMEHSFSGVILLIICIVMVALPFLAIPGYGLYYLCQSTGSFGERFKRTCRPTDWYPVELEHRQQYEEVVGNTELTHQLFEVTEEVN
ncbi:hypothetical protein KR018_000170 [Drosophila ironensis]|nr:hypothetical protein KR018_000170 [Drosophila ironensis]